MGTIRSSTRDMNVRVEKATEKIEQLEICFFQRDKTRGRTCVQNCQSEHLDDPADTSGVELKHLG